MWGYTTSPPFSQHVVVYIHDMSSKSISSLGLCIILEIVLYDWWFLRAVQVDIFLDTRVAALSIVERVAYANDVKYVIYLHLSLFCVCTKEAPVKENRERRENKVNNANKRTREARERGSRTNERVENAVNFNNNKNKKKKPRETPQKAEMERNWRKKFREKKDEYVIIYSRREKTEWNFIQNDEPDSGAVLRGGRSRPLSSGCWRIAERIRGKDEETIVATALSYLFIFYLCTCNLFSFFFFFFLSFSCPC